MLNDATIRNKRGSLPLITLRMNHPLPFALAGAVGVHEA
jgi:hypothetical protein